MPIETDTATAPAYWASYLINGDDSGLTDEERAYVDRWVAFLAQDGWRVVSTKDDEESWFSWYHDAWYCSNRKGGYVLTYILIKGMR